MSKLEKSTKHKHASMSIAWRNYFALLAIIHACIAAPLLLDAKVPSYAAFLLFCMIFLPAIHILSLIIFIHKNPKTSLSHIRSLITLFLLSGILGFSSLFAVYMIWQKDLNFFVLLWSLFVLLFLYRLQKIFRDKR